MAVSCCCTELYPVKLCLSVFVSHHTLGQPGHSFLGPKLKCSAATYTQQSGQDHFCLILAQSASFHECLFCTLSHPLGPTVNRNFRSANLAASLVLASAASASAKWSMLLNATRHVDRFLHWTQLASRQQSCYQKQVIGLSPPKVNIQCSLFAAVGNE